jgi:methionyl-tRNA formyltransferase
MTEKFDAGDIIAQIKFPIPDMTSDDLVSKSIGETPALIEQIHRFLSDGALVPQKQDESKASYFRFERESDNRLLWNELGVQQIYNLVRTGRAFCYFKDQKIGIKECSISETDISLANDVPAAEGSIVDTSDDSVVIKARNGYIGLQKVVFKGRTKTAKQLMKRLKMQIGEKFN